MASQPFVVELLLQLPSDTGQDLAPVQFQYSGTFNSLAEYKLELTGAGTKSIDFGTMPAAGAKLILAKVEVGVGVAPVGFRANGGLVAEEVSAGGAKFICSPVPVAGITSLDVDWTTAASVRVLVLG